MIKGSLALAILFFLISFIFLNPKGVYGFNIKFVKQIQFDEKSKPQIIPRSFAVTEDGLFLIPDHEAGNIKIYEMAGKYLILVITLGRKGFGSDEFNRPAYCFYDKKESRFVAIDVGSGTKKAFIYDRLGKVDFKRASIVPKADGYDMKIGGDGKKLIISGFKPNQEKKPYDLYVINLDNPKQVDFLLPSHEKYGLSNEQEYRNKYKKLAAIGIRAFIDVQTDDVYFVWEGKLKIIKINLKTGKQIATFGQSTEHYKEPFPSKELLESYHALDHTKNKNARDKMSFISDIFATPRHIFIVYSTAGNFRMQMYTLEGTFLGDIAIQGNLNSSYQKMWFDKDSYTLYSLVNAKNQGPQILIYEVNE